MTWEQLYISSPPPIHIRMIHKNRFGNTYDPDRPCPNCEAILGPHNTDYNAGTSAPGKPANLMYDDKCYHEKARIRMSKRKRQSQREELLNTGTAEEYFNWVDSQKKPIIKVVTSSIKSRNSSQYAKLKELYNYTCQVEGCYETEVQFAHILKHSLPNSVDNHTNGWCICCNHHNAYDSNRMIVEVDSSFVRYNVHGDKVEEGRIIYNEIHEVDPQFIILAREWHDRKK